MVIIGDIMKKRLGFTLIELIISLSIVGIISVTFLNIFNMGLINISNAGRRTDNVISIQDKLDLSIVNKNNINSDVNISDIYNISVDLPGIGEEIVDVRIFESKEIDEFGNEIIIRTLIPE